MTKPTNTSVSEPTYMLSKTQLLQLAKKYVDENDEDGFSKQFMFMTPEMLTQLIKQVQSEEQMRIHDILAKKSVGRKTSDRLLIVELMESLQKEQE